MEQKGNKKERDAKVDRKTSETEVFLYLSLDRERKVDIETPSGFFNHMLELLSYHARMHVMLRANGDIEVDNHHLVEDVGLVMGEAFKKALGKKENINRYGSMILPMDEALVLVALDFSGRSYLNFDVSFPTEKIGDFDVELIREFFEAFVRESGLTLHIKKLDGENGHHIAEAIFKGFGRAIKEAVSKSLGDEGVPSTKGRL
ncbi:imidazoleglycerol-phosphate dehydratase HisB [Natranaerofaba carboxydovora]|uniref:imidazoleglycerol-phosphate dehydratase HisB n=1 Tax=Natranaerofaba carboxydovora TaxID=2742683 RepID=UPI001F1458B0|nr:imidazoleglycerol-phosphate dehydratase HisB [Natranaerofaba carboxydovora]UMZ73230.1 Imidazoleglycerol-phosphate dehydratase [Natranaerofaba carboxydovora]